MCWIIIEFCALMGWDERLVGWISGLYSSFATLLCVSFISVLCVYWNTNLRPRQIAGVSRIIWVHFAIEFNDGISETSK